MGATQSNNNNNQNKIKQKLLNKLLMETQFNEQELMDWYREFHTEYPMNYITVDELQKFYQKIFPSGNSRNFVKHVFRTFDLNHDGCIDFREFMCALSITSRGDIKQKLRLAFNIYDVDGDGYIIKSEMLEIFKSMYKMFGEIDKNDDELTAEKRVKQIFEQMDQNHDGKLSLNEFIDGVESDPTILKLLNII